MSMNLIGIVLLAALAQDLTPAQVDTVKAAYKKMDKAAVEAKPSSPLPPSAQVKRVDVSERIRSASFGHKTFLIIPMPPEGESPRRFWVEYGKSTNHPGALYGPFLIDAPQPNSSQPPDPSQPH
jgi:hypothetical protein